MAVRYELLEKMIPVEPSQQEHGHVPIVTALDPEEFEELTFISQSIHDELAAVTAADSNYIDFMSDYIIGSFAIPDKENFARTDPEFIAFYMDKVHLIFVDNGRRAETILEHIQQNDLLRDKSVGGCLCAFTRAIVHGDLVYLGQLEDKMEDIEEAILDRDEDIAPRTIVNYRRFTMRLAAYYRQVANIMSLISENGLRLLKDSTAKSFRVLANDVDRLVSRMDTIESYSTQLRELYQTQIDLKQNSIMQVFTIVTVIFVPLTLVTGWFGMNLEYMPGLDWPFMVPFLLAASLILCVLLIYYFRRKKWL